MNRSRFIFDNLESAAYGLQLVLMDARNTTKEYLISGLSASQILKSGLILEGDISSVVGKLNKVEGALEFAE